MPSTDTPLSLQSIVVQMDQLLASDIETEAMLLDLNSERYYAMDDIGTRVWHLLAQPCQVAQICETLLTEFEVDPSICEQDVLAFVQRLSDARLIRIVAA